MLNFKSLDIVYLEENYMSSDKPCTSNSPEFFPMHISIYYISINYKVMKRSYSLL